MMPPDLRLPAKPEWTIAAIMPAVVSPHPNFASADISGAARLALISEYRLRRQRHQERFATTVRADEPWALELISAAEDSLASDSQADAGERLWALAERTDIPIGARTAAALYGSVAYGETERADMAAARLGAILDDEDTTMLDSASSHLCLAVLSQQRVLRLLDARAFGAALTETTRTVSLLPTETNETFDAFDVSDGISWDAQLAQQDAVALVRAYADESRAQLEGLEGDTWVKVVRRRRSWPDYRASSIAAERDTKVLRDAFEFKFESTSGTRYFMRTSAVESGYAALLLAELGGSPNAAPYAREQLARVLLIQSEVSSHNAREAVRLLRQANAEKPLQSTLNWLRNNGPLEALKSSVESVLTRSARTRQMTESDLLVAAAAGDLLSRTDLGRLLEATAFAIDTDSPDLRPQWAILDKVLRATQRLLNSSGASTEVARHVYGLLELPSAFEEPMVDRLKDIVGRLMWDEVSDEVRAEWIRWARSSLVHAHADAVGGAGQTGVAQAVLSAIDERNSDPASLTGMELAIDLVNHSGTADPELLKKASSYLVSTLLKEELDAKRGVTTFGGPSTADVAAAISIRHGDEDLWEVLTRYLADPDVSRSSKAPALDRLALTINSIPVRVQTELRSQIDAIIQTEARSGLFEDDLDIFASALRLAGVLGTLTRESTVMLMSRLAAGNPLERIEGARTIPFVVNGDDGTWAHALLLQLSRDSDPMVRAQAGASLARTLRLSESLLSEVVSQRLIEFIGFDGIRVPLLTMRALADSVSEHGIDVQPFVHALRAVVTKGFPSLLVHEASTLLAEQGAP